MRHRVLGTLRGLGGIILLGGALALAGCDGPRLPWQPVSKAPPPQQQDATCTSGGIPVSAEFKQQSCSMSTREGMRVLHATYAGGQIANRLDPRQLGEGGWQQVDANSLEESGAATGYDVYFSSGRWLVVQWVTPKNQPAQLTVDLGTPLSAQPACGQKLQASGTVQQGLPLPTGYITVFAVQRNGNIIPACLDDVQKFYTTAIAAQGGKVNTAFAPASDYTPASGMKRVKASLYTGKANGDGLTDITLAGNTNTATEVVVGQLSRPSD